jgi:hypothetical protein
MCRVAWLCARSRPLGSIDLQGSPTEDDRDSVILVETGLRLVRLTDPVGLVVVLADDARNWSLVWHGEVVFASPLTDRSW